MSERRYHDGFMVLFHFQCSTYLTNYSVIIQLLDNGLVIGPCIDKTNFTTLLFFPISTIGKLEPSYVIRKFLDAQRIHNLTAYLQALHRQSLANADHTTLLLNCYTKLKDSSKLEEFIKVTDE